MLAKTDDIISTDPELLDYLSTAIICLDDSLDITMMNTAAESLLSISARKACQLNLLDIVEIPDSLLLRMQESLLSERAYNDRQVTLTAPAAEEIVVDCTITPLRSQQKPTRLLLELVHVTRQLKIAREEALVTQQQSSRSLLRGLAHEIKNPLGGLRGAAQLLEGELEDDSLKDYTSIIIRESDRLQQLIDRMLGPANRPNMQLVNIHAVLEHVRKIINVETGSEVSLHSDYDPSIPEFISDHDRLVQIFLNIAGNAMHAVGSKGKITFRTRVISNFTIGSDRHRLVIAAEIMDNGKGISEEMQEQIFFPMVTGSSTGTGLGLSIAQTTVNQIGGLIECFSKPSETVFTVFLPLSHPGQSTQSSNSNAAKPQGRRKINE